MELNTKSAVYTYHILKLKNKDDTPLDLSKKIPNHVSLSHIKNRLDICIFKSTISGYKIYWSNKMDDRVGAYSNVTGNTIHINSFLKKKEIAVLLGVITHELLHCYIYISGRFNLAHTTIDPGHDPIFKHIGAGIENITGFKLGLGWGKQTYKYPKGGNIRKNEIENQTTNYINDIIDMNININKDNNSIDMVKYYNEYAKRLNKICFSDVGTDLINVRLDSSIDSWYSIRDVSLELIIPNNKISNIFGEAFFETIAGWHDHSKYYILGLRLALGLPLFTQQFKVVPL